MVTEYDRKFISIIQSAYPLTKQNNARSKYNQILQDLRLLEEGTEIHPKFIQKIQISLNNTPSIKENLIGKLFNDLFDFEFVEKDRDPEDMEHDYKSLTKIVPKFIVSIFCAFKNLNQLPKESIESMIENFAKKLCSPIKKERNKEKGGQGWGNFQERSSGKKINYQILKEEIIKNIEFSEKGEILSLKKKDDDLELPSTSIAKQLRSSKRVKVQEKDRY